ncbi:acyl-CoA dehydrogenase family protein [Haloterrigena alkaliphila]|uniref:Acyl-CoA dehydrogenase family protein n=1 Tax=Haloterrigena alkaliphila TaxID=2816475 RepID=A0A8A2VH33_9EURY|nr:acyl-CoA dehydrogenase family protein [Haloterrigena alkaliphila]QSW99674.1 acyl-CoA dehydrogenase family protein [Haloterrigena alkaliphila]
MSFHLEPEQEAIRDAVRTFGENEIRPVAAEYEAEQRYPAELLAEAAALDFVAPHVPTEYGGAGMDPISTAIVTEELWRADPGVGGSIAAADFGTGMLVEYGDEWMCEEWLPRITAGETPIATGISEPAHGSNVAGMETRAEKSEAQRASERSGAAAEKEGDEYVIDGQKMWITNGTVADVTIIMAKTSPEKGHAGVTAFLTPTDVEGYEATPITNKLGIEAQDTAEIVLDGLRVPEENVVGEVDRGFYQLMEFFAPARVDVAAQATGVAQAALEAAIDYAGEREQFDRPIAEFQAIRHKIAEMATGIEAGRSLAYRAASALESGDDATATKLAAMAKLFASENAVDVTDEALQVHGGAGYVSDHPVERFYRDARITKIYDGTSEIQKNIVADQLL